MQFYSKFLFDSLESDVNYKMNLIANSFLEIYPVNVVENKRTNGPVNWDMQPMLTLP